MGETYNLWFFPPAAFNEEKDRHPLYKRQYSGFRNFVVYLAQTLHPIPLSLHELECPTPKLNMRQSSWVEMGLNHLVQSIIRKFGALFIVELEEIPSTFWLIFWSIIGCFVMNSTSSHSPSTQRAVEDNKGSFHSSCFSGGVSGVIAPLLPPPILTRHWLVSLKTDVGWTFLSVPCFLTRTPKSRFHRRRKKKRTKWSR